MPKFGDLTYSEFIPTYAGAPLQELGQLRKTAEGVGDSLQRQYHANRDTADTISIALANMRVSETDPAAMKAKQEAETKLRGALSGIQEAGNWEHANPIVRQAARDLYTDKNVMAATENFKRLEEYYNTRNKMIAELGVDNVLELGDKPEEFTQLGEDGQLKYFRGTPERRLQYHEMKQDIWKNVAADLSEDTIKKLQLDGEDMAKLAQGSTYGISPEKIEDLLDEAMTMYQGTDEFSQEKRLLQSQGKDPESEILNSLKATGMMHTFRRRDTKLENNNKELQRLQNAAEQSISNLIQTPVEVMKPGGAYKDVTSINKDKDATMEALDIHNKLWNAQLTTMFGDSIPSGMTYQDFDYKIQRTKQMDAAYNQGRNALISSEEFKKLDATQKDKVLRTYDSENSAYDVFGTPVFLKYQDMFYDKDGKNRGLDMLNMYYNIKDKEDRLNSIIDYEQEMQGKALNELGYREDTDYFNSDEYRKLTIQAQQYADNVAKDYALNPFGIGHPAKDDIEKKKKEAYQNYLEDNDPLAAKYNELVEQDSKTRTITSFATKAAGYNIGEKNMNEALIDYGANFFGANGVGKVRYSSSMDTPSPDFLNKIDPKNTSLVGIDADSDSPNGYVIRYMPQPKDGEKFDEDEQRVLEIDAPHNVNEILLTMGIQAPITSNVIKVIGDAEKTPNRKIEIFDGVKVEYTTSTDKGGMYNVYVDTKEGEQLIPNVKTSLDAYQRAIDYLRVTTNLKYGDKPSFKDLGLE